jgi:hypothetical protein
MLDRYDYTRDPITNDAFVNHTRQVEFTFEMVRRAAFPKMNSRFQSYFAWEERGGWSATPTGRAADRP